MYVVCVYVCTYTDVEKRKLMDVEWVVFRVNQHGHLICTWVNEEKER